MLSPGERKRQKTPTLIGPKGNEIRGKWHKWLTQSRMPLVQGRVRLVFGACPGVARFSGCVFTRRPRKLYIRRDARSPKAVLYHELGHTFDLVLLRRKDRKRFRRILHTPNRRWFQGETPPSELFAESYALCTRFGLKKPTKRRLHWTRSVYGYHPSHKQHKAICTMVREAGGETRQKTNPKPQPPPNAPPVIERKPPPREPDRDPDKGGAIPVIPGLPNPDDLPHFPASYSLPLDDD